MVGGRGADSFVRGRSMEDSSSAGLRKRVVPPPKEADANQITEEDDAEGVANVNPLPWHALISVRVVVFLLVLFGIMHLFLWKVVYDFAMDTDHDRLRQSSRDAWIGLKKVREHLNHFGSEL